VAAAPDDAPLQRTASTAQREEAAEALAAISTHTASTDATAATASAPGDVEMGDAPAESAAPAPLARRTKRTARNAGAAAAGSDGSNSAAAAAVPSSPVAAVPAVTASGRPARRSTAATRNYAELERSDDEEAGEGEEKGAAAGSAEPEEPQEEEEEEAEPSESEAAVSSESASDADDDFVLTPEERNKRKQKKKQTPPRQPKVKASPAGRRKKPATTAPSEQPAALSGRKPTAAQRKRSFVDLSPTPPENVPAVPAPVTPASSSNAAAGALSDSDDSVVEIDAFAPSAHKPARAQPTASTSGAAAAAAWSNVLRAPGTAPAASSKSNAGKPKGKVAAGKPSSTLSSSTSSLPAAEKERRLATLISLLGGSGDSNRATLTRYLEAAQWQVDAAACNVMDSSWFQSSHTDQPAAPAAAAASSAPGSGVAGTKAVTISAPSDAIELDGDDDESAEVVAAAAPAKRKAPSSDSLSATAKKARAGAAAGASAGSLDAMLSKTDPSSALDDSDALPSLPSSAPAVKPISWSRKLLLILNVSAMALSSGKGILNAGDALEFRREPFDMEGWVEEQKHAAEEKQAADAAAANERAMQAASNTSGAGAAKKKPPISRAKSKTNTMASLAKKRAPRVLRFSKRGSSANSLELGSVPRLLSDVLAPLYDAGFVELESEVLYAPPVLSPFDTVSISLSVFVLPALFLFRPPPMVDDAPSPSENPFFRKIYAKKKLDSASATWNPIQAFVRLLKECDVQPRESAEQELDEAAAAAAANGAAAAPAAMEDGVPEGTMDESKEGEGAATSAGSAAAASSSAAAAAAVESSMDTDDAAVAGEVDGAADGAADNAEGASISKYQLNALYASAAASCATIPEADAPATLKTTLRPYQRQALHWMMARENPEDEDEASSSTAAASASVDADGTPRPPRRKHPLWDEYSFADAEETPFFLNSFSKEISLEFPPAKGSCRGGILADEMGMGKTVMCISVILANHPANVLLDDRENQEVQHQAESAAAADSAAEERKDEDIELLEQDAPDGSAAASAAAASAAPAAAAATASPASSSFFSSARSSRARHRASYMLRDGVCGATLVVCPMSLLSQWRDEIARFTGGELEVLVYYGAAKDRRRVVLHEYDVVLTSYGVLASEHRAVQAAQSAANSAALSSGRALAPISERQLASLSPLLSTTFFRLLLDEGHIIRNRGTETAKAVFALRGVRRWVVSGTIIQNKLDDVYAPLRFLGEDPWASWGWWNAVISQPFAQGNELALQRLRAILSPLMLRRTKSMRTANGDSIVELPPKTEDVLYCDFSEKEEQFYRAIYARSKAQFEGFVTSGVVSNKYIQILTLLLRLRQCADHPFLVLGRSNRGAAGGEELDKEIDAFIHRFASRVDLAAPGAPSIGFLESLSSDLKKTGDERVECPVCISVPEIPVLTTCAHVMCRDCCTPLFNERGFARCPVCRSVFSREKLHYIPALGGGGSDPLATIDPVANWQHSCKTKRLLEELRAIRTGDDPTAKAIVFSQWTSMLDLLEIPLKAEGLPFLRLDGSLSQKDREAVLKRFSDPKGDSPGILLISLKAGGVGLNLVAANHVFFVDCWWNGFVEDQAAQRVHRIGQKKPTFIRRLIVRGTVEERILELQQRKRALVQSVNVSADAQAKISTEELVDLFRA